MVSTSVTNFAGDCLPVVQLFYANRSGERGA